MRAISEFKTTVGFTGSISTSNVEELKAKVVEAIVRKFNLSEENVTVEATMQHCSANDG